jgi:hypothetical protein
LEAELPDEVVAVAGELLDPPEEVVAVAGELLDPQDASIVPAITKKSMILIREIDCLLISIHPSRLIGRILPQILKTLICIH